MPCDTDANKYHEEGLACQGLVALTRTQIKTWWRVRSACVDGH